jgi:hypothetical protein
MSTSNVGFHANTHLMWLLVVALASTLGCSSSHGQAAYAIDPGTGGHGGATGHADGGAAVAPDDASTDCDTKGAGETSDGEAGGAAGGAPGMDAAAPDAGDGAACVNVDCDVGNTFCSASEMGVDLCVLGANGCTMLVSTPCPGSAVCQYFSDMARCSGQELAEWPISNGASDVSVGAPHLQTFVDNLDGTVTDKVTGLMWEQAFHLSIYPQGDFCATSVTTGGYSDWRMPTIIELISLADFTRDSPSIDTSVFPLSDNAGWFWSSTIREGFGTSVDIIDYSQPFIENAGGFGVDGQPGQNIRCVR